MGRERASERREGEEAREVKERESKDGERRDTPPGDLKTSGESGLGTEPVPPRTHTHTAHHHHPCTVGDRTITIPVRLVIAPSPSLYGW